MLRYSRLDGRLEYVRGVTSPSTDEAIQSTEKAAQSTEKAAQSNEKAAQSTENAAVKERYTRGRHTAEGQPIRMLNDRILVKIEMAEGERRSSGGILIPATAQVGKRLAWAKVVAVGPNVRAMQAGDKVLFNPEDRYEVEVRGDDYIILRERDIHAVAADRLEESAPGLYI
ncbi:MAG: chaperonin GroES [Acidimicrobiia bacterium]|nr:chaperonin GroES [Acidimicrobiia bacterium]